MGRLTQILPPPALRPVSLNLSRVRSEQEREREIPCCKAGVKLEGLGGLLASDFQNSKWGEGAFLGNMLRSLM